MERVVQAFFILFVTLFAPPSALRAAPITFEFTGVVILGQDLVTGRPILDREELFSGYITIDTANTRASVTRSQADTSNRGGCAIVLNGNCWNGMPTPPVVNPVIPIITDYMISVDGMEFRYLTSLSSIPMSTRTMRENESIIFSLGTRERWTAEIEQEQDVRIGPNCSNCDGRSRLRTLAINAFGDGGLLAEPFEDLSQGFVNAFRSEPARLNFYTEDIVYSCRGNDCDIAYQAPSLRIQGAIIQFQQVQNVPLPVTSWLLGIGLCALVLVNKGSRRRELDH